MNWKQLLKDNGWKFYKSCNCGGLYREKWKKGDYQIAVTPSRSSWQIVISNKAHSRGKFVDFQKAVEAI